jgi:hypothetical protein
MLSRIFIRIARIVKEEFTWYIKRCQLKNGVARMAR